MCDDSRARNRPRRDLPALAREKPEIFQMPRRTALQGVANNLASSFVSRNNDIDGYWALGMLYLYCQQNAQTSVSFALTPPGLLIDVEPLSTMARTYAAALEGLMHKHGAPEQWLSTASIETESDVEDRPFPLRAAPPFLCHVRLTSDLGRIYQGRAVGYCRPHNPHRESKSTRLTS